MSKSSKRHSSDARSLEANLGPTKIEAYKASHLDGLIRVWESASQLAHPFLSKGFLAAERKNIATLYLPNGDAWVAVNDGRVVGFTILHSNEIGALFVCPDYHRLGIGYALMNKAHELHGELKVEAFKENAIGVQFYLRVGFDLVREYLHQESTMVMLCLEYKKDS